MLLKGITTINLRMLVFKHLHANPAHSQLGSAVKGVEPPTINDIKMFIAEVVANHLHVVELLLQCKSRSGVLDVVFWSLLR